MISFPSFLNLAMTGVFLATTASAQITLVRRLEQNRHTAFATHDFSRAGFTPSEERSEYFDGSYSGKWKFGLGTSAAFDTNVFKDGSGLDDWHWDYALESEYEWWVSKESGLQIAPSFGMGGSRFAQYDTADLNALLAGVKVSILDKLPVDLELSYAGEWDFDGSYSHHVYTAHDTALAMVKAHELSGGRKLEWTLGGGRLTARPSSSSSWHGDATVGFMLPVTEHLGLQFSGGASYVDFINPSIPSRDQWLVKAGVEMAYALGASKEAEGNAWGRSHQLVLGAHYASAADRDPAADFHQFVFTIGVSLSWEKLGLTSLFD